MLAQGQEAERHLQRSLNPELAITMPSVEVEIPERKTSQRN